MAAPLSVAIGAWIWKGRNVSQFDIQVGAILRRYELLAESGGAKADLVADAILHCVENGYWRPDEKMPAEQVLAEALPVSLGTIQAAYRRLAADGIVARRRKGGTRLTSRVDVDSMNWHLRFQDIDTGASLSCRSTVLQISKIGEVGAWSRLLPEVTEFTCIVRRWSIGSRFTVSSKLYISGEYHDQLIGLGMKSLDDVNLRAVFRDMLRMPTLRAAHSISFRAPTAEEVAILGVKTDGPIMLLEANGYTYRDQPFSYQAFAIPTDLGNARLLV